MKFLTQSRIWVNLKLGVESKKGSQIIKTPKLKRKNMEVSLAEESWKKSCVEVKV